MVSVLIVDDEKLVRDTLMHYVDWSALGVDTVLDAGDGIQALNVIRAQLPSIVIADIKMPHMDGIELAKEIRKQYPGIRFVFLSGYADKPYLKEAIHLHVDAYIEKPLNLNEISGLVRTLALECRSAAEASDPARVFFRGDTAGPPLNDRVYTLSGAAMQSLGQVLNGADRDEAVSAVRAFCEEMQCCEGTSPEYIRNVFFQAALLLRSAAALRSAPAAEEQSERFSRSLFEAKELKELAQELLRITGLLFETDDEMDLSPVMLVNKYLQKNYGDSRLSIGRIAQELNFNSSYLCTVYKQRTGKTINRALTEIRMQKARACLESSEMQLQEIAALVGYSNGKYFTKVFAKETGLSPKDYRRLHHV